MTKRKPNGKANKTGTAGMTKLEFVQQRIQQIREFLLSNGNIASVSTDDGQSMTFDRAGAMAELEKLERQEQNLLNPGHRFKNVDLQGTW